MKILVHFTFVQCMPDSDISRGQVMTVQWHAASCLASAWPLPSWSWCHTTQLVRTDTWSLKATYSDYNLQIHDESIPASLPSLAWLTLRDPSLFQTRCSYNVQRPLWSGHKLPRAEQALSLSCLMPFRHIHSTYMTMAEV